MALSATFLRYLRQASSEWNVVVELTRDPKVLDYVVCGGRGNPSRIGQSTDLGLTWTDLGDNLPTSETVEISCLEYIDTTKLFCGTITLQKIYESTNLGVNWHELFDTNNPNISDIVHLGNDTILVATSGTAHTQFRSRDNGVTWENIGPPETGHQALAYCSLGNGVALVGTATSGRMYRTVDYGTSWYQVAGLTTGITRWMQGITDCGSGTLFAMQARSTLSVTIYKSTDYGENWSVSFGPTSIRFCYCPQCIAYVGDETVVGVGYRRDTGVYTGWVVRSDDMGTGWSETAAGAMADTYLLKSVLDLGSGIVLCGGSTNSIGGAGNARMFRSTDYGANWDNLGKVINNRSIACMEYCYDSEDRLVKYGQTKTFDDIEPILGKVGGITHKLQPVFGRSSVAKITFDLVDPNIWKDLMAWDFLKNRRVVCKVGPIGDDVDYTDYYTFFTGILTNYGIRNEVATVEAEDDLYIARVNIPEQNETKTQTLNYQNQNPVDTMYDIMVTQAGLESARVDQTEMESERDTWYQGWIFDRVITDPKAAKKLLDELQEQTLSFIFPDGDQITMKSFSFLMPGQTASSVSDTQVRGSLKLDAKFKDNLINRCVVLYDYDEGGGDEEKNYESVAISEDEDSQASTEWNETATKTIKSKWIRTYTIAQPTNITGVVVYHASKGNGAGDGTLTYDSVADTLTYTAPGEGAGDAVTIDTDGKYQIISASEAKYIRVVVTHADLPVGNQADTLAITGISGDTIAAALARKYVVRYGQYPQAEISYNLPFADAVKDDNFIKPGQLCEMTTESLATKNKPAWSAETLWMLSAKMDWNKKEMGCQAVQMYLKRRYIVIGPAAMVGDYDAETDRHDYFFIGDAANNEVGAAGDDGYYVWGLLPFLFGIIFSTYATLAGWFVGPLSTLTNMLA